MFKLSAFIRTKLPHPKVKDSRLWVSPSTDNIMMRPGGAIRNLVDLYKKKSPNRKAFLAKLKALSPKEKEGINRLGMHHEQMERLAKNNVDRAFYKEHGHRNKGVILVENAWAKRLSPRVRDIMTEARKRELA